MTWKAKTYFLVIPLFHQLMKMCLIRFCIKYKWPQMLSYGLSFLCPYFSLSYSLAVFITRRYFQRAVTLFGSLPDQYQFGTYPMSQSNYCLTSACIKACWQLPAFSGLISCREVGTWTNISDGCKVKDVFLCSALWSPTNYPTLFIRLFL